MLKKINFFLFLLPSEDCQAGNFWTLERRSQNDLKLEIIIKEVTILIAGRNTNYPKILCFFLCAPGKY